MKKKIIILIVILAAAAAAVLLLLRFLRGGGSEAGGDPVYVQNVGALTGTGSPAGAVNRFAGVVEPQDTWSVDQNPDAEVKEVLVTVGQEVKKGDVLFVYDTEKYGTDLEQAEIDLERMNNELASTRETIEQLEAEKKKASAADQGNYTIQIQEQELAAKQKELEIRGKENEMEKIREKMENASVVSEEDGVVKSIRSPGEQTDYGSADSGFITIMKTGDFRIKGTVNEQNYSQIWEGAPVLVHSRVDDSAVWRGTISRIDTENESQQGGMYYGYDSGSSGSKYPFYVELEDSSGLIMGQHVYLEVDYGQEDADDDGILRLEEYFIDLSDPDAPFVWADGNGKLEKRAVTLGEYDPETARYEILDGLAPEDSIAFPEEGLTEGRPVISTEEAE